MYAQHKAHVKQADSAQGRKPHPPRDGSIQTRIWTGWKGGATRTYHFGGAHAEDDGAPLHVLHLPSGCSEIAAILLHGLVHQLVVRRRVHQRVLLKVRFHLM